MVARNDRYLIRISKRLISPLLILLTISSLLALIRYTWYAQPPHLSPMDTIHSRILEEFMYLTGYTWDRSKLLTWNALNAYHNSRLYASYPVSYSPIMLASSYISSHEIIGYDILWSSTLVLEINKYVGKPPSLEEIARSRSIVLNTLYTSLFIHSS